MDKQMLHHTSKQPYVMSNQKVMFYRNIPWYNLIRPIVISHYPSFLYVRALHYIRVPSHLVNKSMCSNETYPKFMSVEEQSKTA